MIRAVKHYHHSLILFVLNEFKNNQKDSSKAAALYCINYFKVVCQGRTQPKTEEIVQKKVSGNRRSKPANEGLITGYDYLDERTGGKYYIVGYSKKLSNNSIIPN